MSDTAPEGTGSTSASTDKKVYGWIPNISGRATEPVAVRGKIGLFGDKFDSSEKYRTDSRYSFRYESDSNRVIITKKAEYKSDGSPDMVTVHLIDGKGLCVIDEEGLINWRLATAPWKELRYLLDGCKGTVCDFPAADNLVKADDEECALRQIAEQYIGFIENETDDRKFIRLRRIVSLRVFSDNRSRSRIESCRLYLECLMHHYPDVFSGDVLRENEFILRERLEKFNIVAGNREKKFRSAWTILAVIISLVALFVALR